jgi:RNA polymerase primary sigma factor
MLTENHHEGSLLAQDQYVREMMAVQDGEPLTEEEGQRLMGLIISAKREPENQWLAMRAKHARSRLVEAYQPLVLKLARRVQCGFRSMELLDLVNEGNIGLLEAVDQCWEKERFDGSFTAFAAVCIRRALWMARYETDGEFRLPTRVNSVLSRMHRETVRFQGEHGYEPSVCELAQRLGVSEEFLLEARCLGQTRHAASLHGLLARVDDEEDKMGFASLFQQETHEESTRRDRVIEALRQVMEQELTPREREMIERRYGLHDGTGSVRLRHEIAQEMGVTVESVDCYSGRAKRRLYEALKPFFPGSPELLGEEGQQGYTTKEVSKLLGLSPVTVKAYAREGRLPVRRVASPKGRHLPRLLFPKQAIDELVAQRRGVRLISQAVS